MRLLADMNDHLKKEDANNSGSEDDAYLRRAKREYQAKSLEEVRAGKVNARANLLFGLVDMRKVTIQYQDVDYD